MKKLLSLFLASLMVLAVIPATGVQFVVAADVVTENTAYLQPTSGNDATAEVTLAGESNKNPFKTITKAYNSLAAAGGGRLIIEENFTFSSGISSFDAHSSLITISAASDAVGIEYVGGSETHWIKFAGPVVFENIKFVTSHTFYLLANHNPLTIGEGVSCVYNDGTTGIVIAGGTFNISGVHCNTDVTVKSGNWRCVVGGGVASNDSSLVTDPETEAKTSKNQNGTFKITIENGTVGTLIGGNWATSKSYFLTGGQAYMYVKGGTVGQLYYGGNDANQAVLHNSVLVYTGGHIGTIKTARTMGICTLIYGENISRNETDYPNAAFSLPANSAGKEYKNVFVANVGGANKNVSVLTVNKLNAIPLATSKVVYVNTTGPFADNETGATALGTKQDPVRYMHQAIAMLTYTGGTIMLDTDYTFAARELNGMSQFVEPDHAPIVIDGQGHKLDGPAGMKSHVDFASATDGRKTTVAYGYNTYLMNGDTTFKNVDVAPSHDMNFAANYNSIVFGKDVVTTNVAWISGAIFLNNSYNSGTYVNNHYDVYQYYRDADTSITIESGTRIKLSGYSRLLGQSGSPVPHYTGTANITINGGTVDTIYTAPTNCKAAVGGDVNVVINGGKVKYLCVGGHDVDYGINDGDVKITINGGNVVDYKTGLFANCKGTLTYVVNTCYSDYIARKNAFASLDAVVDTDIEHLAFSFAEFDVGVSDTVNGLLQLRARYSINDKFFDNEDYNIVEMGVLVKLASVNDKAAYIKGANGYYYAPVTIGGEESAENYSGNIAKSVAYVQATDDATKSAVANYMYDGQNPVVFTAPVVDIKLANGETGFTFVPYVVLHNSDKTDYQVFYGDESSASVLRVAQLILDNANSSEDDKVLAQSIKTAIEGGYGE